jgi:hypothetical protein
MRLSCRVDLRRFIQNYTHKGTTDRGERRGAPDAGRPERVVKWATVAFVVLAIAAIAATGWLLASTS